MPMRLRSGDLLNLIALTSASLLTFDLLPAHSQQAEKLGDQNFGYYFSNSRWPADADGVTRIPVCWMGDALASYPSETAAVRQAIENSWQKHARLSFRGWQECTPRNFGIKIVVEDVGARVTAFGKNMRKASERMYLNFTFQNWNSGCADVNMRANCITSIAVHEFGHAIGFAHEQDRGDAPGECANSYGTGTTGKDLAALTPYDPSSAMNYCNPEYNNNGILSDGDTISVQKIYGAPRE
ncbi:hypothetical protein J2045_001958 [Peteryoungia aggregata LMG 23059]|uniref:Peptidase metallopeptidase domain-containing protein n=1 Tax=Peteryoungia aggregata LMG 23059 TaxID=1368425 RepID=A0ABU0G6G1_9HYPH|nr:M57 family metalloprotease [Peteryoungia aggregata]MDQ0420931.1 hypothetical protein [Peteryoungia aggregata LMG 23059]